MSVMMWCWCNFMILFTYFLLYQMVMWTHSASTYASFSNSICLVEWWCDDGVILCCHLLTFCYIYGDLITFLQALIFQFLLQFILWNMLCWWCNLLFTFCYIHGYLITLCTQRSHTHIRSHLSLNKIKLGQLKSTQNEPNTLKDPPAGPKNT
jgi:hypothetical protein